MTDSLKNIKIRDFDKYMKNDKIVEELAFQVFLDRKKDIPASDLKDLFKKCDKFLFR